jgi:DNA-binding GntR family transcriptional regulator/anti-sigma regulatory factor (Ser/Thr protein kinase)
VAVPEHVNRTELAYRFLVDEVLGGRWEAGETISTYRIAAEVGISRTPVAEALKRLESEGLVEIIPQVGCRIVGTSPEAVAELFAMREALDGLAAEAAARRIGDGDIEELDTLEHRLEAAVERGDPPAYADLDAQLHLRIVDASRIPRLAHASRSVWLPLRHQLRGVPSTSEQLAHSTPEHRELLEALRRRSPRRARAAAERHAMGSGARILARLGARAHPELRHGALIYDSESSFLDGAVPFLAEGIAAGERVLAVTTPDNIAALERALGAAAGAVEFRDSAAWYRAPAHTLLGYERYVAHADRLPVRVLGEPLIERLTPGALREWTRYESSINVEFADAPVAFLCPYDGRTLPEAVLENVRRTHPEISAGAGPVPSPEYTDTRTLTHALDATPFDAPAGPFEECAVTADLRGAREFVVAVGERAGLSGTRLAEALLAVQELAANAVEHGSGGGRLRAWVEDGELIYELSDDGPGAADPLAVHLTPELAARSGPGGLWLARLLSDLVEVRSGNDGVAARLHLRLP